jgi:D-glycero-D-manno-heptose 1,7-bisphosphate phosphatase
VKSGGTTGMRKAVFFDRDGIVNRSPGAGYVERWADFILEPSFVEVLRETLRKGYVGIVVSNQSCVARGIVDEGIIRDIHQRLQDVLTGVHGVSLTDIVYCPHDDGQCDCRKPQPGMLVKSARKHGIDLAASWMVGDQERDVEAGRRAGCRTILVRPGLEPTRADYRVKDLDALKSLIAERF